MRGGILLLFTVLVACGSASPVRTLEAPQTATPSSSAVPSEDETIAPSDVPLLASFLVAVDDATQGTSQQGIAFEDPEGVIGTAVLFCDLLGQGLTVEEVMTAYIAALVQGEGPVTDDELELGGVILGAGVRTICPEFQDRLDL